jgi:hypothetical protein
MLVVLWLLGGSPHSFFMRRNEWNGNKMNESIVVMVLISVLLCSCLRPIRQLGSVVGDDQDLTLPTIVRYVLCTFRLE